MHFILDRRTTKGNASENRQKFLKRIRSVIKEAMQDSFKNKSIKEIGKDGQLVEVDAKKLGKTLDEPHFSYDYGDEESSVIAGNDQFSKGDQIEKPQGGKGGQPKASDDPENGEDPFTIQLTQEEFLKFFFEDLELPDLVKKDLKNLDEFRTRNAGYTSSGSPSRLSVVRSLKNSLMRRMALQSPYRESLNEQKSLLEKTTDNGKKQQIVEEIAYLEQKIKSVPFVDDIDLRYRNPVKEPHPSLSATMICIMDNSGSMGEREKTLSRKFFYLLYLFLTKKYKKVELIFIHHTTSAREVDEEEFFNMKEMGGTVVSSAIQLTDEIIKERGLSKTNLYICQCSDGDNLNAEDNAKCVSVLNNAVLPSTQYYAYIQIQPEYRAENNIGENSLWNAYGGIIHKHFAQQLIFSDKDIYPVFRKLFEKKAVA